MAKKVKKQEEELDFYERTKRYTVVSEEVKEDGSKVAVLKTYSGATVICRIPPETEEERREKAARICKALIHFAHPDWDLSQCKYMEVKIDD